MVIRVTEQTAPVAPALIDSATAIGVVGTLLGGDAATDFATAATPVLLTAAHRGKLTGGTGAYLGGTALYTLRRIAARIANPIVFVPAATSGVPNPTQAAAAVNALPSAPATLQRPDLRRWILLAPELTWERGTTTLNPNANTAPSTSVVVDLGEAAQAMYGIALATAPAADGSTASTNLTFNTAWAGNVQANAAAARRLFLLAPRVGASATGANPFKPTWANFANYSTPPESFDAVGDVAALIAYLDNTHPQGVGANPNLKALNLTSGFGIVPNYDTAVGILGGGNNDAVALQAAQLNTFTQRAGGYALFGSQLAVAPPTTGHDPLRQIHHRREADEIYRRVLQLGEVALENDLSETRSYAQIIDRIQPYISSRVTLGTLASALVQRARDDTRGDANLELDIILRFPRVIEAVNLRVSVS